MGNLGERARAESRGVLEEKIKGSETGIDEAVFCPFSVSRASFYSPFHAVYALHTWLREK